MGLEFCGDLYIAGESGILEVRRAICVAISNQYISLRPHFKQKIGEVRRTLKMTLASTATFADNYINSVQTVSTFFL